MPRMLCLAATALGAAITTSLGAQPTDDPMAESRGRPAYLEHLFLPPLVMRHQDEIGLTDAQRSSISTLVGESQRKLVELRWQSEAATQKLGTVLANQPIDEAAALGQARGMLDLEQRLRITNLGMLISVRNLLTPAQQKKLEGLRPGRRARRRPARVPPGAHAGGPPGGEVAPPPGGTTPGATGPAATPDGGGDPADPAGKAAPAP
jgi:Spy/CpxP family protein refolding chaperone